MEKNLYDILGVSKNATQDELKKQYRKLSKQYHPDMQSGKTDAQKKEAEEKFKEINAAYATLSDEDKRRQYDQFGSVDGNGSFGNESEGFNPFDFFRSHFGGSPFGDSSFGDFGFHENFTRNRNDENSPEDGGDIRTQMRINFKEMLYGCVKEFDIDTTQPCSHCSGKGSEPGSKTETCKTCGGSGRVVHTTRNGFMMSQTISPCSDCHGTGVKMTLCSECHGSKRHSTKKHVSIKIPAGIQNGQLLRVRDAGECGLKGGKNGDMYVQIVVLKDNSCWFERVNSNDISIEWPIDALKATIGGNVSIETPWGTKNTTIKPMTSSGDSIVMKEEGIHTANGQKGDLIVKFKIVPFSNVDDKQKKMIDQLLKSINEKNIYQLEELKNNICSFRK